MRLTSAVSSFDDLAGSLALAQVPSGMFTANSAGRGKFANDFISLALIADGLIIDSKISSLHLMSLQIEMLETRADQSIPPFDYTDLISVLFTSEGGWNGSDLDTIDHSRTLCEYDAAADEWKRTTILWTDTFTRANGSPGRSYVDGVGASSTITSNKLVITYSGGSDFAVNHALRASEPTRVEITGQAAQTNKDIHIGFKSDAGNSLGRVNLSTNGKIYSRTGAGFIEILASYSINTDYKVEFRNIDWTAQTYDVYLDNTLKQTGVAFESGSCTNVGGLAITGSDSATGKVDGIVLEDAGDTDRYISIADTSFISLTATQMIVRDTRETGDAIVYELYDGANTDASLPLETYNEITLVDTPTHIEFKLSPKGASPTNGVPAISSVVLKGWY